MIPLAPPAAVVVLLTLLAPVCLARTHETLAVHPLIVAGRPAPGDALATVFAAEVARLDVDLVSSEDVRQLLRELRTGACVTPNERCLAELARRTQATRSLKVAVTFTPRALLISGQLVSGSGAVLRTVTGKEYPRGPNEDDGTALRTALRRFLQAFDVTSVELAPLVSDKERFEPTPWPKSNAAGVASRRVEAPASPALREASYVAFGVAVSAAIGASAAALSAHGDARKLEPQLVQGQLPAGNDDALRLQRALQMKSGIATGLLITSAVSAAAGGVLYVLSPGSGLSASASPHGAAVALRTAF